MRKLLILIIFLPSLQPLFSQTTFQKVYGDAGTETEDCYSRGVESLKQTSEGGYIIAGSGQYPEVGGRKRMYLIKTDSKGDTLWTRKIGDTANSDVQANSIIVDNQGNYVAIINGFSTVNYLGLIKINPNGDTIWTKCFTSVLGNIGGYELKQTSDNGYIALGYGGFGEEGACLIKTDINGMLQWSKQLLPSVALAPLDIIQTKDKGYLIAGSYTYNAGFAVKTDSIGNVLWIKNYADSTTKTSGDIISVIELPSGDLVFAGDMSTGAWSCAWEWILKTDNSGNPIWSRRYADTNYIVNYGITIVQTPDKGFALAGNSLNYANILKTDSLGNLLWTKDYYNGEFNSVVNTNDKGYALSGYTTFGVGARNFFLVKTDSLGNCGCNSFIPNPSIDTVFISITTFPLADTTTIYPFHTSMLIQKGMIVTNICFSEGILENKVQNSISVFPNPSFGQFTFELSNIIPANQELDIYNMLGEKVYTTKLCTASTPVNLSSQPKGVYLYRIVSENTANSYSGKLIIQ
jgi:hypothetical protein